MTRKSPEIAVREAVDHYEPPAASAPPSVPPATAMPAGVRWTIIILIACFVAALVGPAALTFLVRT